IYCNFYERKRYLKNTASNLFNILSLSIKTNTKNIIKENVDLHTTKFLNWRTHTCGELDLINVGEKVKLCGWLLHSRFNKFIIIKDTYGVTQVLLNDNTLVINSSTNFTDLQDYQKFNSIKKDIKNLIIPLESIISVEGFVTKRPPSQINNLISTGKIEIIADKLNILNLNTNPNSIKYCHNYHYDTKSANNTDEHLVDLPINNLKGMTEYEKLRYRYAYLRTSYMQNNLRKRAEFLSKVRNFLNEHNFIEVETPSLFKPTLNDMGASEFLVPKNDLIQILSNLSISGLDHTKGIGNPFNPTISELSFYALCQSPQLLKQLLMIGGMDRYYQIAKCFRNEKRIHHERQPEFTQIDLEMSFSNSKNVMLIVENFLEKAWPSLFDSSIYGTSSKVSTPFPVMTFEHAMTNYGTDKPDMRFEDTFLLTNEHDECQKLLTLFNDEGSQFRSEIDKLFSTYSSDQHKFPSSLYLYTKSSNNSSSKWMMSQIYSFDPNNTSSSHRLLGDLNYSKLEICQNLNASPLTTTCEVPNDVVLCYISEEETFSQLTCGKIRNILISNLSKLSNTIKKPMDDSFKFLWVIDFPLFKVKKIKHPGSLNLESVHHPFTAPIPEHRSLLYQTPLLTKNILSIKAQHYDIVVNGVEIGGGSVRIHDSNEQRHVLESILEVMPNTGNSRTKKIIKTNPDDKYGSGELEYFLEALASGCPPHAGIALGLDRIVAIARNCSSIQDVMAFPKSSSGKDVLSECPCSFDQFL
ncbi:aspartate--tRNA ligase, mitochondrial-like, partial [Gordionus sp. m RMFG-2023]|uniref:aspartate--tRNA ligase, mitochondrial-like n=1 Tax=Gordionus sp. m RMFG-2023 TaxID=3053472 RepID=UPI0031FCBA1B